MIEQSSRWRSVLILVPATLVARRPTTSEKSQCRSRHTHRHNNDDNINDDARRLHNNDDDARRLHNNDDDNINDVNNVMTTYDTTTTTTTTPTLESKAVKSSQPTVRQTFGCFQGAPKTTAPAFPAHIRSQHTVPTSRLLFSLFS